MQFSRLPPRRFNSARRQHEQWLVRASRQGARRNRVAPSGRTSAGSICIGRGVGRALATLPQMPRPLRSAGGRRQRRLDSWRTVRTATARSALVSRSILLQPFNGYPRPRLWERAQQQAANLRRLEPSNLVKLIEAELHAQQWDAARHWLYLICPTTNTAENDIRRLMAQQPK
jgi:hypothetical protein